MDALRSIMVRHGKHTGFVLVFLLLTTALRANPPEAASPPGPAPSRSAEPANPTPLDAKALSELALEHSRARDELLAAEARLALISEKVFSSRLMVHYEGTLDTPFRLALIEMDLDGELAYRQEFTDAPTAQMLKLFDSYLPPGRHVLQLRVFARGPEESADSEPGYFAASGMAVHLRDKALSRATFTAEQDGDAPEPAELKRSDPEGSWEIEIQSHFETSAE